LGSAAFFQFFLNIFERFLHLCGKLKEMGVGLRLGGGVFRLIATAGV